MSLSCDITFYGLMLVTFLLIWVFSFLFCFISTCAFCKTTATFLITLHFFWSSFPLTKWPRRAVSNQNYRKFLASKQSGLLLTGEDFIFLNYCIFISTFNLEIRRFVNQINQQTVNETSVTLKVANQCPFLRLSLKAYKFSNNNLIIVKAF